MSFPAGIARTTSIDFIQARIAPLRTRLTRHPLYAAIRTQEHLRLFMQSHVFAVWDFMSLLKALQRELTCVDVPWAPSRWPESRRFINEIVLGEESDRFEGRAVSHFELYLQAMRECGANIMPMEALLVALPGATRPGSSGGVADVPMESWLAAVGAPGPARAFSASTFRMLQEGSLPALAAAFTFGREDVIPDLFRGLVRDLNEQFCGRFRKFVWYLERHIEVDGEDHGPLSLRMVADLCGDDEAEWEQAARAAETSLKARLALWDGILAQIERA